MMWPCPSCHTITSEFGWRYHPIYHTQKYHSGVDIGASYGASIVAADGGTVITADMVVQVLVDGKDPATLPVTTFDNGIAMINTESCAALGYDLAAVKQAFDGKCSSVLETTTQQNFD